jgi:hypothetical protein
VATLVVLNERDRQPTGLVNFATRTPTDDAAIMSTDRNKAFADQAIALRALADRMLFAESRSRLQALADRLDNPDETP